LPTLPFRSRKTGRGHQKIRQPPERPPRGPRRQGQIQRVWRELEAGKTKDTPEEHDDAKNARAEIGVQRVLFEFDPVAKLSKSELHGLSEDYEKTRQGTIYKFLKFKTPN